MLIADLCIDEYTDHGHCGVLDDRGDVDNDATLEIYARAALAQARAGAHVVAPSGMMDGQVGHLRRALDGEGFQDVAILAYSAKYASGLYGPFRDAVDVTIAGGGDRKGYQQDWRNAREALREIELDVAEGADLVMVKPALAYLDVIAAARRRSRRAGCRLSRQRRVRHGPRRRRQRLDRRRGGRARAPHGDQAGRRRRDPDVLRAMVRRGPRPHLAVIAFPGHAGRSWTLARWRSLVRSDDGFDVNIPYCDDASCPAAGCDPVVCRGLGVPSNDALFERSTAVIPGGVSSSIRAFKAVGGRPYLVARAEGPYVFDVEGRRYIDLVQSYGAVILGHAHPAVTAALAAAARDGTSYGAPTPREMKLAEAIGARVSELRAGPPHELGNGGDEHSGAACPWVHRA